MQARYSGNFIQEIPTALMDLHINFPVLNIFINLLWIVVLFSVLYRRTRKWSWIGIIILLLIEIYLVCGIIYDM
jgi:hypothetical protein